MQIEKVRKTVSEYIGSNLSQEYSISSISKDGEEWLVVAEVFEKSAFIQSIGLDTSAKDKNTYEFRLDDKLEIVGFQKTSSK